MPRHFRFNTRDSALPDDTVWRYTEVLGTFSERAVGKIGDMLTKCGVINVSRCLGARLFIGEGVFGFFLIYLKKCKLIFGIYYNIKQNDLFILHE